MLTALQPMLAMEKSIKKISPSKQRRKQRRNLNRQLRSAVKEFNFIDLIKAIRAGANPNTRTEVHIVGFGGMNKTALHLAAYTGNLELCRLLIEHGADVNAQDDAGWSPLSLAVYDFGLEKKGLEICNLLIQYGANVNAQNNHGTSILMLTFYAFINPRLIKLLLSCGADIDKLDENIFLIANGRLQVQKEKALKATRLLITDSQLYPHPTAQELQTSQQLTRSRLWAMKHAFPKMPKDLIELILGSDQEVWRDACATPLSMHKKRHNRAPQLPLTVLHTLLKHNSLDKEKTVEILANHKIEALKALMQDAAPVTRNSEMMQLLDCALLEQNFGEEIRNTIRADLGITPWSSWCTIQ